jgi:hypothetical protein
MLRLFIFEVFEPLVVHDQLVSVLADAGERPDVLAALLSENLKFQDVAVGKLQVHGQPFVTLLKLLQARGQRFDSLVNIHICIVGGAFACACGRRGARPFRRSSRCASRPEKSLEATI